MKTEKTPIEGLLIIHPDIFKDDRGFFFESYNEIKFAELGIKEVYRQDNFSKSVKNTLRGLHFQTTPGQAKIVRAIKGRIWDVAVDIRKNSPTLGKWFGLELSEENKKMFYIPAGFAHGFCVLSDTAEFAYKVSEVYNYDTESGITWNDPDINIDWPVKKPLLSKRDTQNQSFKEYLDGLRSKGVWLIGNKGMLGSQIEMELKRGNINFTGTDKELDVTNIAVLEDFAKDKKFDWIINCSAYTAVDKGESQKELAFKINASGVENIAKISKNIGAKLVHFSTDYVYNGSGSIPLTEDMDKNPSSEYGKSKLEGDKRLIKNIDRFFIIRISWLYGIYGNNFVKTMIRLMKEKDTLSIVSDQIGTPTYAGVLAKNIIKLIRSNNEKYGVYNYSDKGTISWHDFAYEIQSIGCSFSALKKRISLKPITTDQYPKPAKRPEYSVMNKTRVIEKLGFDVNPWIKNLIEYFVEWNNNNFEY